jgi:hypothetical protein
VNRQTKSKGKVLKRASASFSIDALLPESLSDLAPEDYSLTHKTESRRSVSLPPFQLKTQEERAALRRLKLSWGDRPVRKAFKVLVLAHLALIKELVSRKRSTNFIRPATSDAVRKLRRRAERVRRLAEDLKKPLALAPPRLVPIFPPFPDCEMRLYADGLDGYADLLQISGGYGVAPQSGVVSPGKRPPRRKTAPETEQILKLVEFVRQQTGREHWGELAILVRRATGDLGYNKHRLQSLCSWHWQKRKTARSHRLGFSLPSRKGQR